MKGRVARAIASLFVGLALALMVAEPATGGYIAGLEVPFTGHLYSHSRNLHYCGVGHSQIGDLSDQASGAVFTRPALFFGICATVTSTTAWRGWLAVQLTTLRNGSVCGQTEYIGNPQETYIFGVVATVCSNPAGWQEWRTVGGHRIFDEFSGTAPSGTTISPWAIY
jgi:hypothetical protein